MRLPKYRKDFCICGNLKEFKSKRCGRCFFGDNRKSKNDRQIFVIPNNNHNYEELTKIQECSHRYKHKVIRKKLSRWGMTGKEYLVCKKCDLILKYQILPTKALSLSKLRRKH